MERQQADPEMIRLEIALEAAINAGLTALADEIAAIIEQKLERDSSGALAESLALITAFFVFMATETRNTQVAIARTQVQRDLPTYLNLLSRAGAPTAFQRAFEAKLNEYPDRVRRAYYTRPFPADQVSYQFRIKTVRDSAQRTVRNIVRNGTGQGQSARQIARRVQSYLKPGFIGAKVEPLKEARRAASLSRTAKPSGVRSGSIPYNAIRIARTESAETYRRSHSEMYEGTIFEGGKYDWVLSNSHAGPDVCDRLARQSPFRADQRPNSHPNCLCDWRKRPPTLAEVRELLRRNQNG